MTVGEEHSLDTFNPDALQIFHDPIYVSRSICNEKNRKQSTKNDSGFAFSITQYISIRREQAGSLDSNPFPTSQ